LALLLTEMDGVNRQLMKMHRNAWASLAPAVCGDTLSLP